MEQGLARCGSVSPYQTSSSHNFSGNPYTRLCRRKLASYKNADLLRCNMDNPNNKIGIGSDQHISDILSVSQEPALGEGAYRVQAEKFSSLLQGVTEKAKVFTATTAKEFSDLSVKGAASVAPNLVKDAAKTALDVHGEELQRFARIHDFCLGILYGGGLLLGGLLWFLFTGSIFAIRFGVLPGCLHLYFSTRSLNAWKYGHSRGLYIGGQLVVTLAILAIGRSRLYEMHAVFPTAVLTVTSGVMVVFYLYTIFYEVFASRKPST